MRYFGSGKEAPQASGAAGLQSSLQGVKAANADDILAAVRTLALDVGAVRIGVALSDETGTLASGLDGTLGSRAEEVLAFVERLRRVVPVPVVTRDERLTSVAAGERLAEAGVRRRERRSRIDQAAAALILQEHLDSRRAVARPRGEGDAA
jgi:RNase H-fold protein (predicted Holliday junction resolvase)